MPQRGRYIFVANEKNQTETETYCMKKNIFTHEKKPIAEYTEGILKNKEGKLDLEVVFFYEE